MKAQLATLILALSACGHAHKWQVDPELAPYVEAFYQAAAARDLHLERSDLIVEFGDLKEAPGYTENGRCEHEFNSTHKVVISNQMKAALDDIQLQPLMTHELGHCLLGLEHDNRLNADGTPVSVMHEDTATITTAFHLSREYYYNQLFNYYKWVQCEATTSRAFTCKVEE